MRLRQGIETRSLIVTNLLDETHLVVEIYNKSRSKNWGFLPITDEEANSIADSLRIFIALARFASLSSGVSRLLS